MERQKVEFMELSEMLYKYRSLENFRFFVDIILNNRLYAARYKELNDPMEGIYYSLAKQYEFSFEDKLKEEKSKFRICSFSRLNNDELLWTHYADEQKGIVIGVNVDTTIYSIQKVNYNGFPIISPNEFVNQTAQEIFCHKLEEWKYEEEERVFVRGKRYINVHIEEIITGRRISNVDFSFINSLIEKVNPKIKVIKAETIMKY